MAGIDILQVLQQITAAAARANDAVLHLIVGSLHFLDKRSGGHGSDGSSGLNQVAAGKIVFLYHQETPMAIVADRACIAHTLWKPALTAVVVHWAGKLGNTPREWRAPTASTPKK